MTGDTGPPGPAGPPRRGPWAWALRLSLTAAVLVVVAVLVGPDALRDGAAVLAPGPVAAALVLGLVWRALAATRWVLVARALGVPLRWVPAYLEYLRSELLNQVLPGAVLGDVDRARRHGADVGLLPAGRAVALERLCGQLVLVLVVVGVLVRRPDLLLVARGVGSRTVATVAVVLLLVVLVAVALWAPWRRGPALARPRRRPLALALAAAGGLSLAVLACFVALFLVAARATGLLGTGGPAGPVALVPVVLVVLLLAGVPLTVSGWGAREAGAALAFSAAGLAAADGVSAAVGYGLLSLVSALPGLLPLALPRRATGAPPVSRASAAPDPAPPRSRGR